MLIISEVFTIPSVYLLCLCGNREYPGSFQTKQYISGKHLLLNECPSKVGVKRERFFEVDKHIFIL